MATLGTFSAVRGPMQYLVAELLTDDAFFIESRSRVVKSLRSITHPMDPVPLSLSGI